MKKAVITLVTIFTITSGFSQKPAVAGKIALSSGQKIVVESNISIEASNAMMGFDLNSNTSSQNTLEAKNNTDKEYTVSNTLTKAKLNVTIMGQSRSYDSEKKEGNDPEVAKSFDPRLNKPVDVVIDNSGKLIKTDKAEVKKESGDEGEDDNQMAALLAVFSQGADDAVVAGAFELIPQGKAVGDSWQDSTATKDMKMVRTFTLRSVTGNEAVIELNAVINAKNKVDFQAMEIEFKTETKTSGEIITDITTAQVKKRTSKSDITATFPIMGQDVSINGKANSTNTYR
jgi:hypothetical protein